MRASEAVLCERRVSLELRESPHNPVGNFEWRRWFWCFPGQKERRKGLREERGEKGRNGGRNNMKQGCIMVYQQQHTTSLIFSSHRSATPEIMSRASAGGKMIMELLLKASILSIKGGHHAEYIRSPHKYIIIRTHSI